MKYLEFLGKPHLLLCIHLENLPVGICLYQLWEELFDLTTAAAFWAGE